MATAAPPRVRQAAIYCRISNDPSGREAGVKRQEADCRALVKSEKWRLLDVYTDNDISAWNGKSRPEYRRLCADIEAGLVDVVVFWKLDRLTRRIAAFSPFFELCSRMGTEIISCREPLDTSSPMSVGIVHMLVGMGEQESQNTSDRLRRALEEKAREGFPKTGGKRAFGYERDGMTVNKAEARLIKQAAKRVLAGEGLITVANGWTEQGVPTVSGGPWSTRTLKRILTSPRVAGLVEYKGVILKDAEAQWPAILDEQTHERLKALLLDPKRNNGGTTARKYLLAGIAYCELCDARLVSRPRRKGARGENQRSYACISGSPYDGCGALSVIGEPLEDLVREELFSALDSPAFWKAVKAESGDDESHRAMLDAIREDEEALEQLAKDHYADRLISRAEFLEARRVIEERLDTSKRRLQRTSPESVLASIPKGRAALESVWEKRDLHWRRAAISSAIERVVVGPAVRGRNWFDPERVEIIWKV